MQVGLSYIPELAGFLLLRHLFLRTMPITHDSVKGLLLCKSAWLVAESRQRFESLIEHATRFLDRPWHHKNRLPRLARS
jgi:hypothetical protein